MRGREITTRPLDVGSTTVQRSRAGQAGGAARRTAMQARMAPVSSRPPINRYVGFSPVRLEANAYQQHAFPAAHRCDAAHSTSPHVAGSRAGLACRLRRRHRA